MLASRLSLLLLLAACGGKTIETEDGGTTDGGPHADVIAVDVGPPPMDAFPPPNDGSSGCNTVDPGTKTIAVVATSGSPPPLASTGDTIQPGLYELTGLTVYGTTQPASTVTAQMRVFVTNNGYLFEIGSVSDNQAPTHTNENANVLGVNTMTVQQTCPSSPDTIKASFAAEPQSLVIRLLAQGITVDEEFALLGP